MQGVITLVLLAVVDIGATEHEGGLFQESIFRRSTLDIPPPANLPGTTITSPHVILDHPLNWSSRSSLAPLQSQEDQDLSCYHTDQDLSCYHTDQDLSCYHTDQDLSCYHTDQDLSCYHTDQDLSHEGCSCNICTMIWSLGGGSAQDSLSSDCSHDDTYRPNELLLGVTVDALLSDFVCEPKLNTALIIQTTSVC
ncbi:hypothetical protein WMY93_031258 [Mugilogobius chulae]|uniref:Uncharacterized protein n=1 Tax=Mugilogobius chulae TaxID=88201 RepID=A0AAW0MMZ8_9GOBI